MARMDIFGGVKDYKSFSVDGESFKVPVLYRKLDSFFVAYGADALAVTALMPSVRIKPLRVWPGRAVCLLLAFNYHDTDLGAYGEFMVGFPCSVAYHTMRFWGVYVHRLPVTTHVACVAGKHVWGYPKFVGQMEFSNTIDAHSVKMSESGQHILDLWVKKGGMGLDRVWSVNTFTVLNQEIIMTRIQAQAMTRVMPDGFARLNPGAHEMGRELLRLRLGQRPIITGDFLDVRLILPEGQSLGLV